MSVKVIHKLYVDGVNGECGDNRDYATACGSDNTENAEENTKLVTCKRCLKLLEQERKIK